VKIDQAGADELAEPATTALSAATPANAIPTEPTVPVEKETPAETAVPSVAAPAAEASADAAIDADVPSESSGPSWASFRNSLGNVLLALLFFVVLIPTQSPQYRSTIATEIWFWGAVMMGVLSLLRVPPRSAMVNLRSILATGAMMVAPALLRPDPPASTGWFAYAAIAIEIVGITYTQVARLYLGRRFGLLPANRGIVSTGPFRWVRHPIYSGWVILTIGYLMAYPNLRNLAMFLLSLPFLVWRMALEEEHLVQDPEYREYLARTRWRLIPGIF
jgi:protein-S-isoprenylcysteine O-methyltransferase Ste14